MKNLKVGIHGKQTVREVVSKSNLMAISYLDRQTRLYSTYSKV
ncbi:MAG: hypothetical protein CM15mP126_2600 [Gammaproteobacteria bacterium]|nr:MAG: hypothetical protein CM15mP126_2600 [Gammaproteobacteria bacterium]